jgi:CheY-like chemotaxis protein
MSPPHDPPVSEKLRILIVDDEPTLRLSFTYALTNPRTIVEAAATGQQALDRIAQIPYHIMILDLRMPEMDGLSVITTLRGQGNPLPIILCSAAMNAPSALSAIRQGVVDFLLKPVRPVDLRQIIEFVLYPERRPLPLALQAARKGQIIEAIRILESDATPSRQARHWLSLLIAIRESNAEDDLYSLEQIVRECLPILAFNSPNV